MNDTEVAKVVSSHTTAAAVFAGDLASDLFGNRQRLGNGVLAEQEHPVRQPVVPRIRRAERPGRGIVGTTLCDVGLFDEPNALVAADLAVKAAPVDLIEIRLPFAMGGKAFTVFTGEVSAVRSAVNTAAEQLKDEGVIDSFEVIPSPHKDLIEKLL